jgi:type I restriction enzyme S subunit
MAHEWPTVKLRDVLGSRGYVRGPFGSALRRPELVSAGVPVYEQQHAIAGIRHFRFFVDEEKYESLKRFTVRPNDVIISCSGTVGRVSLIGPHDPAGIISQALLILRPDVEVIDPHFLYYFLSSRRGYNSLVDVSTGSVQVNLAKRSIIENTDVPLPPLGKQKAIAAILRNLDDKIELNQRRNQTLEAMARAIFQSWFVDFDPVKAKAAVRREHPDWTNQHVSQVACPRLPSQIAEAFPDAFEECSLGQVPTSWQEATVGDIASVNRRTLSSADDLEFIDYIEISEVMRGQVNSVTRYSRETAPGRARRRLAHGDTVLSTVRPDRGAFFLCLEPTNSLIASTGFVVLTPRIAGHWGFVFLATTNELFGQELGRLADGGAYPAVRPEVVASRPLVIPDSQAVLAAFESIVQPLLTRTHVARQEMSVLMEVRDSLLPRLISGELAVGKLPSIETGGP